MSRVALSTTFVLLLAANTPAQAKHFHKHLSGKHLPVGIAPAPHVATNSDTDKLSPTALNAECAIAWQDSLHGEIN